MTVTVTGDGHESSETTRLFPPSDPAPPLGVSPLGVSPLGVSPSPEPLPVFDTSPVGKGCRMTTRVEVMVETMVVVGSSGAPEEAPATPFSVALEEGAVAYTVCYTH